MARLILRDVHFKDSYNGSAANFAVRLLHDDCMKLLLRDDVRQWLKHNAIRLRSYSQRNEAEGHLQVIIYAMVDDSLATYYHLRWGNAEHEDVYT